MADRPRLHDARLGLPAQALDELRQATELALAVKDRHTAILGYWVLETGSDGQPHERLGGVVLPSEVDASTAPPPMRVRRAQRHAMWQELVRHHLRPGDTPVAERWAGQLCLRVGPLQTPARPEQPLSMHFRDWPRPVYRHWRRGQQP
jgi:hypothetical protein